MSTLTAGKNVSKFRITYYNNTYDRILYEKIINNSIFTSMICKNSRGYLANLSVHHYSVSQVSNLMCFVVQKKPKCF